MKFTTILVAALGVATAACASAPATPTTPPNADGALRVPFVAPTVGDEEIGEMTVTSDFVISLRGQETKFQITKQEKKRAEVLEVTGEVTTKVKATYETSMETSTSGGVPEKKEDPVVGRTYIVALEGGAITVTDDRGGAVPPLAAQHVSDDWDDKLGKVPGLTKVVTGRAWNLNEKVVLSPEQLKDFDMGDSETTATAATFVLRVSDGKVATFDIDAVLDLKVEGGVLEMTTHIVATIDIARARALTMTVTGTFDGDVRGTHAKGTMEGIETATYR